MDLFSYLLSLKKAGGGGSGGDIDWSAIGYSGTPQIIIDGYNYALDVKNNWTDDTNLASEFADNKNLVFFPKVTSTKATTLRQMFDRCINLIYCDFTDFNISAVTRMDSMFSKCYSLKELDLSSFTSEVLTRTNQMFNYCLSLNKIDMRNMDFTILTNFDSMFGFASEAYVPANCLIIVKDDTQKSWFNTNFSRMTNVKTVAEYESSLNN